MFTKKRKKNTGRWDKAERSDTGVRLETPKVSYVFIAVNL